MKSSFLFHFRCFLAPLFALTICCLNAAEINPAPPQIIGGKTTNGEPRLVFPYPGAQRYEMLSAPNITGPFLPDTNSGRFLGPAWIVTNGSGAGRFYKVGATVMSSNDMLAGTVLNRLTYGPTPDDIDRIRAIGPQAFINEQMATETIRDTINTDPPLTNAPPSPLPLTNWIRRSVTGTTSGTNLGIYLGAAGRVYLDNVVLVPHIASATRETREAMGQRVLDNLRAFFAGAPLPSAVPLP